MCCALGTADQPIIFTSAEDAPVPGDWQGLWLGGVMLTNRPASGTAFVTNSTFRNLLGHGVVEGWFSKEAGEDIDFTPTNTFETLSGCPVSFVRKPACW
ncbi:MAG: hypothetical protein DI536_13200 [Archangium gephyra]|uniref:Uncharacterized protein n=1 Tax=Archangium gephyra TaxID=48 RepID=A0A2W5THF3_9BACT|nr:MAG: hypothetical protein DI536_13200 [Archangium gephyra]